MWNRGVNSDAVLRLTGKAPPGTSGGPRGRGGSVDRGRGRGRGGFHYSRGLSYEEPGDGVDSRGGLRGGLDRDRIEGPISSATSFPRNIRPFDRSQVCIRCTLFGYGSGMDGAGTSLSPASNILGASARQYHDGPTAERATRNKSTS